MTDRGSRGSARRTAAGVETRLAAVEQRLAVLEAMEGVRQTMSDYARAIDERRPELLDRIFTDDCHLVTHPWGADTRGKARMLRAFERYWERFGHPRRYYANESITVDGETATAFSYWFVTQDDGDRSAIGWGTYDWVFRHEDGIWKVSDFTVRVLTMTTLDRGWAIPDRIMSPFPRRASTTGGGAASSSLSADRPPSGTRASARPASS